MQGMYPSQTIPLPLSLEIRLLHYVVSTLKINPQNECRT